MPQAQCILLVKALEEQKQIGWHLAMHGYLSRHWGLAGSHGTPSRLTGCKSKDKGKNWDRKTILLLWNFANAMWEHCNAVLHDHSVGSKLPGRYGMLTLTKRSPNCMLTSRPMMWRIDGTLTCHWLCNSRNHFNNGSPMHDSWLPSCNLKSILAKCH